MGRRPRALLIRASVALALCGIPQAFADTGGMRGPEVDLLGLLDLSRDVVRGTWVKKDGVLICSARVTAARVQIPYLPPESYDLEIVAERTEGTDALVTGLASGRHQFVHGLDGYTAEKKILCGFELLDGKLARDNESTRHVATFTNGRPAIVVYRIRPGRVQVITDGKTVLDWAGDFNRLSVRGDYSLPHPRALSIGAWSSIFRISKLKLAPHSGRGQFLPPDRTPAKDARLTFACPCGRSQEVRVEDQIPWCCKAFMVPANRLKD